MTSVLAPPPVATARRDRDPVLAYGRRALPWLLVGTLLGLAAGAGVWRAQSAVAHASTVVELTAVSGQVDLVAGAPLQQVTVDTDAQLLTSDEVVLAAAAAAGRTTEQARGSLAITAAQLTRVLTLTYTDAAPRAARAGAEAAATAFLQARERLVIAPKRTSLTKLGNVVDILPGADPAAGAPAPGTAAADLATPAGRQQAAVAAELALTGPGVVLQHALALPATDRGSVAVPLGSGAGVGGLLLFCIGLVRVRGRRSLAPHAGPASMPSASRPVPSPVVRPRRRPLRPLACGLVLGLVCAAAGLGVSALAVDAGPSGTASFVVTPLPGTAFAARGHDTSVDLLTEAQLVLSDAVLDQVVTDPAVSGATVFGLRGHIDASVLPGSEVVTVAVRGGDSGRVLTLARDLAHATLQVRQDRATAARVVQRNLLQARIADSQTALDTASAPGGQVALAPVLSQRLVTLRDDLRAIPTDPVDAGALIDSASGVPVSRVLLYAGVPVLLGLLGAGLGARLGRHRRPPAARMGPP